MISHSLFSFIFGVFQW